MRGISIIFLILTALNGFSQDRVKVKMKSGSTITGKLIEYKVDDYLIVEIYDNTNLRIPFNEFQSFKSLKHVQFQLDDERRYYNYSALGLLFVGSNGVEGLDWTLHTQHGIQWNHVFKTSLGIGLDRYGDFSALPVYLGGRAEVGKNRVAPSIFTNVGYGHFWVKDNRSDWREFDRVRGGIFWELGAGMTIRRPETHFSLSLSYKSQYAAIDYVAIDWGGYVDEYHEDRIFRNIALTLGVAF